jgi:FtsZ-binding cell division protein ZapB
VEKISLSKPNDMKQLEVIQSKIYDIRGQKVMIDRDLAEMYGVETRTLNQAVKRNVDRFPEDFMFQLTDEETQNWKSQIVITNSVKMGMRRNPYAFTELGVAMLSSVLNSKTAIQINMGIMRAFVAVRQLIALPKPDKVVELQNEVKELKEYIEEVFADYNDINDDTRMQLELINQTLAELQAKKAWDERPRNPIGFKKPGD